MLTRLIRLRPSFPRDERKHKDVGSLIQIMQNPPRRNGLKGMLGWARSCFKRLFCSTMVSSSSSPEVTGCSATFDKATPTSFILPDLVSHCPYSLIYNPDGDVVAQESVEWLDTSCSELSPKQRKALRGLKAGELTAYCYYTAPAYRLRVISDFLNYLFHLWVPPFFFSLPLPTVR
jgi:hypothetical protein